MNPKIVSQNILKELPIRTRDIISRRFALGKNEKPETLESIGKSFKITRERVRQIEAKSLEKMKQNELIKKIKETNPL